MESNSTTSIAEKVELNDKKNYRSHSKNCTVAWSAIGLLLITWLCLFLSLGFFWLKNKANLAQYHFQLSETQAQLSKNQTNYELLQKHLEQLQNFTQKKFVSNDSTVLLANIKQLVQLARYNLIYLHNIDSSLSALTLAESQLAQIISPEHQLENLRQLVTNAITTLKILPHIDLMDTVTRLHALQLQILQLPLLATTISTLPKVDTIAVSNESENKWLRAFQNSLNSFRQLIIIRRLDKPIEPLLPEAEQQYIQHNLQILLQQAQWALLHNEPTIYQSSLQQAQENIQANFESSSIVTQEVVHSLEELKKMDLKISLPDLSPILEAISIIEKTSTINSPSAITNSTANANQKEFS